MLQVIHWRPQHWKVILTAVLLIAIVSTGLAACGYNGTTQGNTSATQPSAQVNVTQGSTPSTQPPAHVQIQQCGFVHGYANFGIVPRAIGSEQAENCFWQAFQHCQPATLVFITSSIGKGALSKTIVRTFTIRNEHSKCSIVEAKQEGTSPGSLSPTTTYICTSLIRHPRALDVLSCGQDGTIRVLGA